MQISERLKAVAALVSAGGRTADIGTDHAYIPIYLIQTQKITHAIAMDVNQGPLARAREHIAQYGLEDAIETRLSDGLEALRPGEADSIVIAGMGGPLTVRILETGKEKLSGCRELILQPQSEIRTVRLWLARNGWRIVQEDMVCEEGKFYPMMRAVQSRFPGNSCGAGRKDADAEEETERTDPAKRERAVQGAPAKTGGSGKDSAAAENAQCAVERETFREEQQNVAELQNMGELQLRYGPLLLRERHPVLRKFLLREQKLNRRILDSLEGQSGEAALERAQEIREELGRIHEALAVYGCSDSVPEKMSLLKN